MKWKDINLIVYPLVILIWGIYILVNNINNLYSASGIGLIIAILIPIVNDLILLINKKYKEFYQTVNFGIGNMNLMHLLLFIFLIDAYYRNYNLGIIILSFVVWVVLTIGAARFELKRSLS